MLMRRWVSIMNRYKLLFCDDDIKYLKRKIQETVEDAYPNAFECTYATDEIFLFDTAYDAYFLDIEMPSQSGFDIAKKIYEKNKDAVFIFMSSHENYKLEGYNFHPFDFIVKDDLKNELVRVLKEVKIKLNSNTRDFVLLKSEGIKIDLMQILYVMSDGNYRHIVTKDKDIMIRSNDEDLDTIMSLDSLLHIRRGVWVNMHHISRFKGDMIEMVNSSKFKVSRSIRKSCYEKYLRHCH